LSIIAFVVSIHHGYILLFGDAVAHINIARRVFDSRTPGVLQLGTVWLPLPHLLMMPFVVSLRAWHAGWAASIPSLVAYVFGVVGVFRLVRGALSNGREQQALARFAAWLAAAVYACNPNLLYMQCTAMTEPLYLAFFIWAIVFFSEFVSATRANLYSCARGALLRCGLCVAAAELTRYDGWFLACVLGTCVIVGATVGFGGTRAEYSRVRPSILAFMLIVSVAPALWLLYNGIVYRNPLEFANGPYSARAIEQRTSVPGFRPHPGAGNVILAGQYFIKAGELNLAARPSLQKIWIGGCIVGIVVAIFMGSRLAPLLLLWIPIPFYLLSMAYGSVPIFIPTWWPFSYYNVRYGTQLVPAAAVFIALAAYWLARLVNSVPGTILFTGLVVVIAGTSYYTVWKFTPICFQEAEVNSRTRMALENAVAAVLRSLPPHSTILMYLGEHGGALQDAAIPFRRTINEGDHRTWKRPIDANGLWERALADPSRYADYAVGIGSDPVANAMQDQHADVIAVIDVAGQPRARIYRLAFQPQR
jgi:hypothetical protein